MAGLMNQQAGPGAAPMAGPGAAPMGPAGAPGEEETNVSPEEQAAYDQFVRNGMTLMYDKEMVPKLLESIAGDGNPVQGLANALVMVVTRLEDSAEKSGSEIPPDVKFQGASELAEQMIELAETAGIHDYSEEDTESALYLAMDTYRTMRQEQGKLPVDQLQQEFGEIVQAEQQGRLDEILPGVTEYAQRAPKPEAPPAGPPSRGLMRG